jgi:hypothetical protein
VAKGAWITSGYKRGDLLIMAFEGKRIAHIGMCTGINPDKTLATIEGNTSLTSNDNGGAVMRRTRYKSQIVGACRPPYPSTAVMERVISILEAEVNAKIKEDPAGSNNVKYNTWYYGRPVSGKNYAWCVIFLAWAFDQAGCFSLLMGGQKTASCTYLATYYGYGSATTTAAKGTATVTLDVLALGSSGGQVTTLQLLLNAKGFDCGEPDGEFGPKTDGAVRRLQAAKGLPVDGEVGAGTWPVVLT